MSFSAEELDIFRQWYNAVEDLNSKYLETKDKQLVEKVKCLIIKYTEEQQEKND